MAGLSSKGRSVDEFFKERLKSCHVTPKGLITGYVDSELAYVELMRDLKVLGCRYSVRSKYARKASEPANLQYKNISPDLQIPFTGSPFYVEFTTYFLCTHGIRYFKSKIPPEDENNIEGNSPAKKKSRKVNESIKIGCPAKMTVKSIRVYPDYKTATDSWRRKCDLAKRLKADLKSDQPPRFELHFWIAVSQESAHNHEKATFQPLHPDVVAEIQRLVRKGLTSIPVIKSQLLTFVDNMFKNSRVQPDPSNTAFYPNDKSIYNHVYGTKNSIVSEAQKERAVDPNLASASENVKVEPLCKILNVSTLPENNSASPGVSAPCHEHQISEKCVSDLAVVPVLDAFGGDWQDQTVLPANLVQVLNNSGTVMFMVTQPLGEQVGEHVENSAMETSPNLVNVNLDDNIYTVITDPSEQRILQLNTDSNILLSQHCTDHDEMRRVLTLHADNPNVNLDSQKSCEINLNRVISMDNSVIMGVQNSSSTVCIVQDGHGDGTCHDDANDFLFVEEDSQTELLMKEVKNKELTDLCALPPTQALKEHEASLFSNTLGHCVTEKSLERTYELDDVRGTVQKLKSLKRTRSNSNIDDDPLQQVHPPSFLLKSLIDCAQDIIAMSGRSTNTRLLEEVSEVFEKYRHVLRDDLETSKKISTVEDESSGSICAVDENISKSGNTYSPSESSVDDYDDLIIIN